MKSPAPWSFSRIKAFEQCPRQFYNMKVVKTYPSPETDAMRYGTLVHEAAEFYIRDNTPVPKKYTYIKPTLDALNKKVGDKLCEYKLGLTADLEPCSFDASSVWFRGIADLIILNSDRGTAYAIDYKTGKSAKYADTGQLELMALAIFKHFPEVTKVRAALVFLVADKLVKSQYHKQEEPELWRKWLAKYSAMEQAYESDVWNASPSGLCRAHCAVLTCPHNGRN